MHEGRLHRAGLFPRFYVRQYGSSVDLACKNICINTLRFVVFRCEGT